MFATLRWRDASCMHKYDWPKQNRNSFRMWFEPPLCSRSGLENQKTPRTRTRPGPDPKTRTKKHVGVLPFSLCGGDEYWEMTHLAVEEDNK